MIPNAEGNVTRKNEASNNYVNDDSNYKNEITVENTGEHKRQELFIADTIEKQELHVNQLQNR